jgi:hypothetical protein
LAATSSRPNFISRIIHRILNRVWYVHPAVVLTVGAPPVACLQTLATAARPSTERLHLRDLFTEGRRYYLQPSKEGFQLTSNSRVPWRRGRTGFTAVVSGKVSAAGDSTQILLRARITIPYLLQVFFVPAFISSIIIFAPWSRPVIAGAILTLFALSWLGHRLNAMLQAGEMVFFVQKALEDLAPAEVPALPAHSENTVTLEREFREQWDKFYEEHKAGD